MLTDSDIPGLRYRIIVGETTTKWEARRFDVGVETIRRAVRGDTFRHIRDYLDDTPPRITGEHAELATRYPVAAPPDERANASLAKVLEAAPAVIDPDEALDELLNVRKGED